MDNTAQIALSMLDRIDQWVVALNPNAKLRLLLEMAGEHIALPEGHPGPAPTEEQAAEAAESGRSVKIIHSGTDTVITRRSNGPEVRHYHVEHVWVWMRGALVHPDLARHLDGAARRRARE